MLIYSDNLFTIYLIGILKRSVFYFMTPVQFQFSFKISAEGQPPGNVAHAVIWQSVSNYRDDFFLLPNLKSLRCLCFAL